MAARVVQSAGAVLLGLSLAGYGALVTLIAPISTRVFYDPALQYMLASLSVFRGAGYAYIDHPGTPVEVLGTVGLALTYPFVAGGPGGFVAYHLAHPELFMAMAQGFLVISSIVTCVMCVGRVVEVRHWTQALAAIGLAAAFFGLHTDAFSTLAIWSHTSFCFLGGTLLSLLGLVLVRQPRVPRWREVFALGFACGVLTSIQLYFAAWVLGAAVTVTLAARLRGLETRYALRRGEALVVMALVGFVVATLPIHDRYLELAGWVVQLSTHQDLFGRGPDGFSSPDRLVGNLLGLVLQQPELFTVAAATLVVTAWRIVRVHCEVVPVPATGVRCEAVPVRAAGAGLIVQTLVLLVLVAKHPASRYLLPVAATLPVLLAVLLQTTDSRRFAAALGLAGIGLFGHGLWAASTVHLQVASTLQRDDAALRVWLDGIAAARGVDRSSLRMLWTYGTTSPCYALWYGSWSAGDVFSRDIARLCPRDGAVDIAQARVWSSGSGSIVVKQAAEWDVEVIPNKLRDAYPDARLDGDVHVTELSSLDPVNYAEFGAPRDRTLLVVVRK